MSRTFSRVVLAVVAVAFALQSAVLATGAPVSIGFLAATPTAQEPPDVRPTSDATSPAALATRLPTPAPPPHTPRPAVVQTVAQELAMREQHRRSEAFRHNVERRIGPENPGGVVTVRGKPVVLPPDAYVSVLIVSILCGDAICPEPPVIEITRGNSRMSVSTPTGRVVSRTLAPGESSAFDFLKDALQ
jgi:hypothetical protein